MDYCYLCILFILIVIVHESSLENSLITLKQPAALIQDKFKVHYIKANCTYNFVATSKRGFFEKHLNTYCYTGGKKSIARLLETLELHLDIDNNDYTQYDGTTPKEVEDHYGEHRSLFSFSVFSRKRSRLSLDPFVDRCIGIESVQPYTVRLVQERTDLMRFCMLLIGIFVFIFAGHLSTNSIFYYITGIVFGICSSFLLLIWLSGKLMPRKMMMYGVVIGGWTFGLYFIQMLWQNLQLILVSYRNYVGWYIVITGMVSFLFCYRCGPPKNRRSKNIIKWLLQLISLALIYLSSNFKEAVVAIITLTVIFYYFPRVRVFNSAIRMKYKTSRNIFSRGGNNGSVIRELRDDCRQWKVKIPERKTINVSSRMSIKNPRVSMDSLQISNDNTGDSYSESDLSANEYMMPRESLYQLPDGSFLLSEKPPKIFNPKQVDILHSPKYHRSTPVMGTDETDADGEYTPKLHQRLPLSSIYTRRLTSASSTSELCVKKGRRSINSITDFQRSSSAQRTQSRSLRMMGSVNKNIQSSLPKIKIQHPESDDSEENEPL